jgi:xanthine dehydrogenase/oxidase
VDLSHAIMDRAILHSDCTAHIPALRIRGRLCRTNQASNTAFRGFGGPQGMLIANMWMDHGARALGMPLAEVFARNMYTAGSVTHFGQSIEGDRLEACWQEVTRSSDWEQRRTAIDGYNAGSRCAPVR